MAKILPVPDPNVSTQPVSTPYEHPFATPQGQGEGLGSALEQAGGVAAQYAADAKQKADTAMELGAAGKAKAALNSIILDPENGYTSLRGDDAMKGRAPALEKFGKALRDIRETLTPDQQRRFEPHAQVIEEAAYTHVIQRESLEQERYAQAQYRGNVDQTMATAENPAVVSDPAALKEQFDSLFQTGIAEARRRFGQNASRDAIQSVLVPELQKAALGTMSAALATQDPKIAKDAFDVVGKYMVTEHQRQVAGWVNAMAAKQDVAQKSGAIVRFGATSVAVPGGEPVARVDEGKVAAAAARLDPEMPNYAKIVESTDKQVEARRKVWLGTVKTVADRVHAAGYDPVTHLFDIDSPAIKPEDRAFLQREAAGTGEWDKLVALDARVARANSADTRLASKDALSGLLLSLHDPDNKERYLGMTQAEFNSEARGLQMLPADLITASNEYRKVVEAANKTAEPLGETVKRLITAAVPNNATQQKQLIEPVLNAASKWEEAWKAATGGKAPKLQDRQDFINAEIAMGKVEGTGSIFHNALIEARVRRIDFERGAGYAGGTFTPLNPNTPIIPQPPARAATSPTAAPAPAPSQFYRYTPDRKTRFPTDAQGNVIGPGEPVP